MLREHEFASGSMGPKVEAARRFASTGGRAAIGVLTDAEAIVHGTAGTQVLPNEGSTTDGGTTRQTSVS
jgi:carbamate kinase